MKNQYLAGVVLASSFLAAPAFASGDGDWRCEWLSFSAATTGTCYGSENPPPNDNLTSINTWFGSSYTDSYKDNNSGAGSDVPLIFDAEQTGDAAGTITFATDVTDPFVLVLKLGQGWSAFQFDTDFLAGSTLTYSPNGDFDFGATTGLGLSHATIYSGAIVPGIPEPETYALMLAGLAAVGFMSRRRRQG